MERVLLLHISHRDDLGDIGTKYLAVEIMGKYSNIILLKEDFTILDAIKRISSVQSSVREVLPGRKYFIPDQFEKENLLCFPLEKSQAYLEDRKKTACGNSGPENLSEILFRSFSGLSPMQAREITLDAGLPIDKDMDSRFFMKTRKPLTFPRFPFNSTREIRPFMLKTSALPPNFFLSTMAERKKKTV